MTVSLVTVVLSCALSDDLPPPLTPSRGRQDLPTRLRLYLLDTVSEFSVAGVAFACIGALIVLVRSVPTTAKVLNDLKECPNSSCESRSR